MGIEWLLGSVKRFEQRAMQAGKGSWIEYISNLTLDKRDTEEEGDGARDLRLGRGGRGGAQADKPWLAEPAQGAPASQ